MSPLLRAWLDVVERHGDAPALIEDGRTLSHAQLLGAVRRLAGRLRRLGVGPASRVGVLLPRSIEAVASMLAVWWVGAAFLPLDPALPPARLAAIAAEAGLSLQIASGAAVPGLSLLDPLHDGPERDAAEPSPVGPDDLAYLIYTSGSTGKPKGVRLAHRGLVPVLSAQIEQFGLGPGKRALWMLSPGFDASLSDVGTALLSGAALCIPRALGPSELRSFLERHGVTHADLPPSLLPLLGPTALEVIVIGGEVCAPAAVREHARRASVLSVYGPTEATICTSVVRCGVDWSLPRLGLPLPHVRYRLLEPGGAARASGAVGELGIGGVALALGYVDRPALEAERFVEVEGERLYRTGDLVRALDDGDLEFLGRVDRQRKLRGHLIAPEEIEARLREHPSVAEAAVVVRPVPRPRREPREALVAFVTGASGALPAVDRHAREHLPPALRPRLVAVEALPRGPSGKVDLQALASWLLPAAPTNPGGQGSTGLLSQLFADVLGLDAVGEHDDFFALGGDSFAALELLAEAEAQGLLLPLDALYRAGSPAALAQAASSAAAPTEGLVAALASPPQPPLQHVERGGQKEKNRLDSALFLPLSTELERGPGGEALVTGATGFFGARLLRELLARGRTVHALVRARDEGEARGRLAWALQRPGGERLRVWRGDAERPRLGLSEAGWEELAGRVEVVVHGAARLHLLLPYEALRGANVEATAEVLALCGRGRPKALHHISTLSVLVATDLGATTFDEDSDPREARLVYGGYAQSKWAAEELLRRSGASFACHRLGLLTGDSETGRASPTCPLALLLRGLAALGCVPEGDHEALRVDVTPVDHAARAVAALIERYPGEAGVYHVASERGASLARLLGALRAEGARCEPVAAAEFQRRARERLPFAAALALLSVARRLLSDGAGGELRRDVDLFQLTGRSLDCRRTEARSGLGPPPLDDALLRRYARAALEER